MMSSTARWSLKSLAFAAIKNCSAQEYDTSSMTNDEGDHCENIGRGCQNITTLSVEYSREGSTADGANPSEAVLEIWACNVPVREHQASAVQACNVPFRDHKASAVLSCNVPVREHQGSAVRACNVPVAHLAKNRQKLLLTAPEGAGGVLSCSCLTRDVILP